VAQVRKHGKQGEERRTGGNVETTGFKWLGKRDKKRDGRKGGKPTEIALFINVV